MPLKKYTTEKQRKKAQDKSNRKYKREKQTAFTIRFHNRNDADVIEKLKTVENRIDYIRQLIIKDIKKEG